MSAHSRAWIWCLATTIAVICIDLALQSLTPLDVTSIALFGVIPVGTLAMVALALSGFYMAGRSKRFEARLQDLIGLFVIALLLLVIPYLWAYMLFSSTELLRRSDLAPTSRMR